MRNIEFWVSLIGAIAVAFVIALWVHGDPNEKVIYAIEYGALVITFLFGFMVLAAIASGKIDISQLLQEKDGSGGASMSRFQLLVFTFVVAISLLLIVVHHHDFPDNVPSGVLALLGISASTYAVSKGIQASGDSDGNGNGNGGAGMTTPGAVTHTTVVAPPEAGGTVTHTTTVIPPTNH